MFLCGWEHITALVIHIYIYVYIYICLLSRSVERSRVFIANANTHTPNADTIPFFVMPKNSSPYHQQLEAYRESCSHLGLPKAVRGGTAEVTYWMSNAPSLSGVSFSSLKVVARVLGGTGCTYDPQYLPTPILLSRTSNA